MILLVLNEMLKFVGMSLFIDMEGKFALHVIQSSVDLHELGKEVWSCKNKKLGKILTSSIVHAVSHITFP